MDETIRGLGLKTCSIVGLSLGGWMVLSYATAYPDKVDKLILLCPGGLAHEKASFLWKAIFFSLLGKWGQLQTLKLVGGGNVSSSCSFKLEEDLSLAAKTFKYFKPRTAKMPIFSSRLLSQLKMPILMLFGDSDQLIPAKKSIKHLQAISKQAKIELLPDTGHLMSTKRIGYLNF